MCVEGGQTESKKDSHQVSMLCDHTNVILIGPSHHGTKTMVQSPWPLVCFPAGTSVCLSSPTWLTGWSILQHFKNRGRLCLYVYRTVEAVQTIMQKTDLNAFIRLFLNMAEPCGKPLAHHVHLSFSLFLCLSTFAGLSRLKGRENKSGAVIGEDEECDNTVRWSKYKRWAQRN